jgi:hypothetical protein
MSIESRPEKIGDGIYGSNEGSRSSRERVVIVLSRNVVKVFLMSSANLL